MRVLLCFTFLYSCFLFGQDRVISYEKWNALANKDLHKVLTRPRGQITPVENRCLAQITEESDWLTITASEVCDYFEYATKPLRKIIKNSFESPEELKTWSIKNRLKVDEGMSEFTYIINSGHPTNRISITFNYKKKWRVKVKSSNSKHGKTDWIPLELLDRPKINFVLKKNDGEGLKINIDQKDFNVPGFEVMDEIPLDLSRPLEFKVNTDVKVHQSSIKLFSNEVKKKSAKVENSTHWNKNKCLFVSAYSSYKGQKKYGDPLEMPKTHSQDLQKEMNRWGFDTVSAIANLGDEFELKDRLKQSFEKVSDDYDLVVVHVGSHGVVVGETHYLVPTQCDAIDQKFINQNSSDIKLRISASSDQKRDEYNRSLRNAYQKHIHSKYINTEQIFEFIKRKFSEPTVVIFIVDACRSPIVYPNNLTRGNYYEIKDPEWNKDHETEYAVLCFVTKNGENTADDGYTSRILERLEKIRKEDGQGSKKLSSIFLWDNNKYSHSSPQGTIVNLSSLTLGKKIKNQLDEDNE